MMKRYLPIFFNIENKNILIVGGGKTAYQKIKNIIKFTNNIIVVAPIINEEIINFNIQYRKKRFSKNDLKNIHIVYCCTNDKNLNNKIKNIANKKGIIVNVVDDSSISDFISPAVTIDKEITIAVSSNGVNIKKAIDIRNKIDEFLKYGKFN